MADEQVVVSAEVLGQRRRDTSHLMKQDLSTLDVTKLTPLTPEVISRQATINIGTVGHVAHGKSTIVKAISGVHTVRFDLERKRNITIMLGYANAKLYECTNPSCPRPGRFRSYPSSKEDSPLCERIGCGARMRLVRHVSFVDVPGHDVLMATMLTGAAVMDAAMLLIAADQSCPQPQTSEHLAAVEIMKLRNVVILQNKVDLIKEQEALAQHREIVEFVEGTTAEGAPIIPISAQLGYNIDVVVETLCRRIPVPVRNFTASPRMTIIRSFDVNRPGTGVSELVGGVAGGTIVQGVLRVGDEIEVRPGIISKDSHGETHCESLRSRVLSLYAEENDLQYAVPGGLIGVGTKIDPSLCRSNNIVGHILGAAGKLPDIFMEIEINFFLLRRLLGVKAEGTQQIRVQKLAKGEIIMINVGSSSSGARVIAVKGDLAKLYLAHPVCTLEGEKLALSRRIESHWRLIGWGAILRGAKLGSQPQHPVSAE